MRGESHIHGQDGFQWESVPYKYQCNHVHNRNYRKRERCLLIRLPLDAPHLTPHLNSTDMGLSIKLIPYPGGSLITQLQSWLWAYLGYPGEVSTPFSFPLNTSPQEYQLVGGSVSVGGLSGMEVGGYGSVQLYSRLVSIMSSGLSS